MNLNNFCEFFPGGSGGRICRRTMLCWIIAAVLWPLTSLTAQNKPFAQRQVITAAMIRDAGISRTGEIVLLIDNWHVTTVDGFTWMAAPGGLAHYQGQNWTVMVDYQPMDLAVFGSKTLNYLPVSIDQIDSVEVFSQPQLHWQAFSDAGLLHIHTRRPRPGLTVSAQTRVGNETGDPGPYIFTDANAMNVDRIGPDDRYSLAAANERFFFRASLIDYNHYATDPQIRLRNPGKTNQDLWTQSGTIALQSGVQVGRAYHELIAAQSTTAEPLLGELLGKGPVFMELLHRELPSQSIFNHIGLRGNADLSPASSLKYGIQNAIRKQIDHPNAGGLLSPDWDQQRFSAHLQSHFRSGKTYGSIGAAWERLTLRSNTIIADNAYSLTRVYGSYGFPLAKSIDQQIEFQIASRTALRAVKTTLKTRWRIDKRRRLDLLLSKNERLFQEDNSIYYWIQRGYDFFSENGAEYRREGNFQIGRHLNAGLFWRQNFSNRQQLMLNATYAVHDNIYLEERTVTFDAARSALQAPLTVRTDISGQVIGFQASLKGPLAGGKVEHLSYDVMYYFQREVAGDRLFKDLWQALPRHKLIAQIRFRPVDTFSMWAAVQYLSATAWSNYRGVAEGTRGLYRSDIPGTWVVDTSARKTIWNNRLRGGIVLRNLFDQRRQYHPVGTAFDLQLHAHLNIYFHFAKSAPKPVDEGL